MTEHVDNRGRKLLRGETQEPDGRYKYRYTGADGKRHPAYSWRLVKADRLPAGARPCEPLRDIEARIQRDLADGITPETADNLTVNAYFEQYLAKRTDLEESTRANYKVLYDKHIRPTIGPKKLRTVTHSDVKARYLAMVQVDGLKTSTIAATNAVVGKMFQQALNDGLIRINPAVGATEGITRAARKEQARTGQPVSSERVCFTADQQRKFLEFIAQSKRFARLYDLLVTLFGTGVRISEAIGLTEQECHFDKGEIHICRQLMYKLCLDGHYHYVLKPHLKSEDGLRDIPLLPEVDAALHRAINSIHKHTGEAFEIDGVSGFLFCNNVGKPFQTNHAYTLVRDAIDAYNKRETALATQDNRKPDLLPKMGPHGCRHSFCTRLNENSVSPQTIKRVMGHKRVSTSQDTYTHVPSEVLHRDILAIDGQMSLK